jgi:hypothetical protein
MMQQAPMMPQQAPPQEQMPDPAQMQQAVIQRLQELEMEKAELMSILQQMEGAAAPQMAINGGGPPMGGPPMGGPPMPMGGGGPPMGGLLG